jgi:hypothetical protein
MVESIENSNARITKCVTRDDTNMSMVQMKCVTTATSRNEIWTVARGVLYVRGAPLSVTVLQIASWPTGRNTRLVAQNSAR